MLKHLTFPCLRSLPLSHRPCPHYLTYFPFNLCPQFSLLQSFRVILLDVFILMAPWRRLVPYANDINNYDSKVCWCALVLLVIFIYLIILIMRIIIFNYPYNATDVSWDHESVVDFILYLLNVLVLYCWLTYCLLLCDVMLHMQNCDVIYRSYLSS